MGMITTVAAFGAGYAVGRPDGRKRLRELTRQATEYARSPEAARLRERGWDVASERVLAAKRWREARSRTPDSAEPAGPGRRRRWKRRPRPYPGDTSTAPAANGDSGNNDAAPGFAGTTVAGGTPAAVTGMPVPPVPHPADKPRRP